MDQPDALADLLDEDDIAGLAGQNPLSIPGLKGAYLAGMGQIVTGSGVSQWTDLSGNGNHLLQGVDASRPALQADGSILFDGVNDFLRGVFTLNQPETIYVVCKMVTWTLNGRIFDGGVTAGGSLGAVVMNTATPKLAAYAGTALADNANLAVGTTGILSTVFNGATSSYQVNKTAATPGPGGALNMQGFCLAAIDDGSSNWANIQVWAALVRSTADDASTQDFHQKWLARRYGIAI